MALSTDEQGGGGAVWEVFGAQIRVYFKQHVESEGLFEKDKPRRHEWDWAFASRSRLQDLGFEGKKY